MDYQQLLVLIGLIGTAIGVLYKYILRPLQKIVTCLEKIEYLDNSNKVILESLLAIMNNLISGNTVDKLKEQRDAIEEFCIKH